MNNKIEQAIKELKEALIHCSCGKCTEKNFQINKAIALLNKLAKPDCQPEQSEFKEKVNALFMDCNADINHSGEIAKENNIRIWRLLREACDRLEAAEKQIKDLALLDEQRAEMNQQELQELMAIMDLLTLLLCRGRNINE